MTTVRRILPLPAPLALAALAGLACAAPSGRVESAPSAGVALTATDSALVGRILLAEDRRDAMDVALREGLAHRDVRVQTLARRAGARIRDPIFTGRDSFPVGAPLVEWPEPTWRLRYRALSDRRTDCSAMRTALADSAWAVRLRALALVAPACASDEALTQTLRQWIDALPPTASQRSPGGVSWHAAAHAAVALARLRPAEARPRVRSLMAHSQWQVRLYAARAAAVLADTGALRALARDADDNVKEAAVDALAKLAPGDHETYRAVLGSNGAQAVRAAAVALKGAGRADVAAVVSTTLERWTARANASERDVRVALLEAAGRPPGEDRPPPARYELPPQTVALALGADVRLRVRMAAESGGGDFVVRLRGDVAPMMAARILALTRARYYDGLDWHRVEHDFVIQGGSPGRNEYVGLPQYLRDELGMVPHARGTVGMSTRGHDTGDAQWFVNLKDNFRLARDYTVFAEVIEGMEVVDGVMEGDVIATIEQVVR